MSAIDERYCRELYFRRTTPAVASYLRIEEEAGTFLSWCASVIGCDLHLKRFHFKEHYTFMYHNKFMNEQYLKQEI